MTKRLLFLFASIIGLVSGVSAQTLNVVVPQLSPTATDAYTRIIEAIADVEGRTANVQILPFARAIYMMETRQADIESAFVQNPDQKKWAGLNYDYSSAELLKIVFVLYANKTKTINVEDLKSGNTKNYKLETDSAHIDHFPFPIAFSTSIDASLKKVDTGAIDGFIFSQGSTDAALRRLGLKNVMRQYYDTFRGVFLLQKGARDGPVDAMISDGIAKLKADGKYKEIMGQYSSGASKYIEWQP